MKKEERMYIAATIDTDGSIMVCRTASANKAGYDYLCRVEIGNRNKKFLKFCQSLIGFGVIYTETHYKNGPFYRLRIHRHNEIITLLHQIKDLLIIKKENADLMIQFCELRQSRGRQNRAYSDEEISLIKSMRGEK